MRLSIAFALTLTVTACTTEGSSGPGTPEEIALENARTTFHANMSDSYTFHSRRFCECTVEATREMLVTVTGGVVTDAIYVDDEQPVPSELRDLIFTIDEAFDEIQSAIDDNAHAITVEYDTELGFPTSIAIDYSAQIADEELSLVISDVQPLTLCGAGALPCG